jgi:trk system potassium uptake protein TrkA
MPRFAIIGLGQFGKCMVQTLHDRGFHTFVIDMDEGKVQWARDLATKAVKADALDFDLFEELVGDNIDCAIVDLGDQMERSILVTNYLHKLHVQQIVVEATSAPHAEILGIVGATRIVFPEKEAAERLAGLLAGQGRLDYFAVSEAFSLVAMPAPATWVGSTLAELSVRKQFKLNVVAVREQPEPGTEIAWGFADPERALKTTDVVLVAGSSKALEKLAR